VQVHDELALERVGVRISHFRRGSLGVVHVEDRPIGVGIGVGSQCSTGVNRARSSALKKPICLAPLLDGDRSWGGQEGMRYVPEDGTVPAGAECVRRAGDH
jgi:hypothetical protein